MSRVKNQQSEKNIVSVSFLQQFSSETKKTVTAIVLMLIMFVIFYAELLSGSKFLWEDYMEQAYPNVRFAADCIRHGWFPFWTPHIFGGMPFASDPQSMMFYPPFWLYLLIAMVTEPGGIAYTWYILLHIIVLGSGTFLMMRGMRCGRSAALFSAVTLMFAGFVSLHVFHTFVYVAAWFPFAFHFLRRAIDEGAFRHAVIGGLFLGVSTLGGYPQYSMHIIYFCATWAIFSWTQAKITVERTFRYIVYFGIFAGLGLALAAVQYLPSFENMAQSVRDAMTFEESAKGAMSISRLVSLFAPSFFGMVSPIDRSVVPFWGVQGMTWCFWETCIFTGILPLFLALRAVLDGKKSPFALFLTVVAGISILLSLGSATPLYGLVFHYLPGFGNFRIPGRFAFIFTVCITMLAGIGLERHLTSSNADRRRYFRIASIMAGCIVAGCLLFFAGAFTGASPYLSIDKVKTGTTAAVTGALFTTIIVWGGIAYSSFKPISRGWGLVAAAVVFVELFAFGHRFAIAEVNPRLYYGRFDLAPLKQEFAQGQFRIQGRIYRGNGEGEMLFPRNLGNVAGIPLVDGYNQLRLSRWNDLMWKVDVEKAQQLFNIRYRKVPGENRLQRLETAPRFMLSTTFSVAQDRNDAIARVNSDAFLPGRDIVLEKEPGGAIAAGVPVQGSVRVVSETPNRIVLEADPSVNCLLTASELYYPAWKAKIDGKKCEVLAANVAFRALPLAAGKHRVEMYYHSDAMVKGGAISLAALTVALLLLFGGRWLPVAFRRFLMERLN